MVVFPDDSKRIAIIGSTGSGKTFAAAWHLSRRSFDTMPWIIFDYKFDGLLNELGAVEYDIKKEPPAKPGLYIVHPLPSDTEAVETFLWKIWAKENVGIYIDEGYMIGQSPAFQAILTQGRSKKIPVIVLSQRPVWMSRFVFSEADFFQVFRLNDKRDKKTVNSFLPSEIQRLPDYHSYYYDVGNDDFITFSPVPQKAEILATFRNRLSKRKKLL